MGRQKLMRPMVVGGGASILINEDGSLELQGEITGLTPAPVYYIDTVNGLDTRDGLSWDGAFKTMAKAFTVAGTAGKNNPTFKVIGDVREEVLTPLGIQGGRIIGSTYGMTRHDDGVRWREPASAPTSGGALLTIREQGWEVRNILFVPKTDGTAVRLRRAEDATYPDGSHAIISNCKFIGNVAFGSQGGCGIENHGGSHHDLIEGCEFMSLDDGIKSTTGAGIANPLRWFIQDNVFVDNTSHIKLPANQCFIRRNVFDEATANIDLKTNASGSSFVLDNVFSNNEADITESDGYLSHATDVWRNFTQNTAAMTVGVPAAGP